MCSLCSSLFSSRKNNSLIEGEDHTITQTPRHTHRLSCHRKSLFLISPSTPRRAIHTHTRHPTHAMKFKFSLSLLLLLFLSIHFCSSVKVDGEEDEGDEGAIAGEGDSDYDSGDNSNKKVTSEETSSPSSIKEESTTAKTDASTDSGDEGGESEAGDNEDEESDDDPDDKSAKVRGNGTAFEVEGEALSRLQQFVLSGVESAIKSSLPMIIRSASETNVSSQCSASFLTLISALRDSKLWAFKSECLPVFQ